MSDRSCAPVAGRDVEVEGGEDRLAAVLDDMTGPTIEPLGDEHDV